MSFDPPSAEGSVRIQRQRFNWIPILKSIYEFESSRVSGPGSWKKDIRDVLWTTGEIEAFRQLSKQDSAEYGRVLDWLVQNRQAMRIEYGNQPTRYVTRVAEIVRLVGHTPEYWYRGRPSVEAVHWYVEDKVVPRRDVSSQSFATEVSKQIEQFANPKWKFNLQQVIPEVIFAVATELQERLHIKDAGQVGFSRFQVDSCSRILLSEFGEKRPRTAQIITAGVGSGKTYAFLIPTLISSLARLRAGDSERRVALLLYPRKALAKDQSEVVRRVMSRISNPLLRYHFEHYDSYQANKESVRDGVERVYGEPGPPPAIVVTTLETLKRRLQHPTFARKITRYLNRIVMDEVHLIEGLGGGNVVRLMDRLRASCKTMQPESSLLWTASSATVASPHSHAATIFGLQPGDVEVIEPLRDDMEVVGLAHHVFLRTTGTLSTLGTLVNLTSIMVHNRRDRIGTRKQRIDLNPKTIGFADSLDLLGRWNADLRENERTESVRDRPHPDSEDRLKWKQRQRELPYAIRFKTPLQRRIDAEGGKGQPYAPILTEARKLNICRECQGGKRISLGVRTPEELNELSKLVYRAPHLGTDDIQMFRVRNPAVYNGTAQEIGTLDLCPYLRSGACLWFPQEDEAVEAILPGGSRFEWKNVIRSKIHSSKTSTKAAIPAEDLGDIVFRAKASELYDIHEADSGNEIAVDVVLASPSLEVGIDLPNVTESIMFHAIRNVTSYRQKAGRVGREEGSDAMNISLMGNRPIDLHFYRQPRKLVSLAQLDPIPLKDSNESILRSALYMAVWDWLALKADLPESIPYDLNRTKTEFTIKLERALTTLRDSRQELALHLVEVSRRMRDPISEDIREAIRQSEIELEFLLSDVKGLFEPSLSGLSEIIPHVLFGGIHIAPSEKAASALKRLKELELRYREIRPRISPTTLGVSKEFDNLDLMSESGWTLEKLVPCIDTLSKIINKGGLTQDEQEALEELNLVLGRIRSKVAELGGNPMPLYFLLQFKEFVNKNRPSAYYLSYTMESLPVFRLLRLKHDYVRIKNLFTNPYEEEVAVSSRFGWQESVPLHEALFSLIPGSWTYRFGSRAIKTKSGPVNVTEGGVAHVNLKELTSKADSQFVTVRENIPGPPGLGRFDIMRPARLEVSELSDKYVFLDPKSGRVLDNDEARFDLTEKEQRQGKNPRVKIPKSFFNQWVYVEPDSGEPIRLLEQEVDSLEILNMNDDVEISGRDALKEICHPALSMFKSVLWHRSLAVTEFVYSCSRSYTSQKVSGVELVFENTIGAPMAFGTTIETEGISLELDSEVVSKTAEAIARMMTAGDSAWSPSIVRAFTWYLSSQGLTTASSVSPFMIRDLVSVLIAFLWEKGKGWIPDALVSGFNELMKKPEQFEKLAAKHYSGTELIEEEDRESVIPALINEGEKRDQTEVGRKAAKLREAAEGFVGSLNGFNDSLNQWILNALLNSFGATALNALQRLAGVSEDVVGYAVDFDGIKDSKYRVFLYDKDPHGSGSSAVGRRFLHILHIQRHGENIESRLLPSDDFLSILEEELLQCAQHHADICALEMSGQKLANRAELGIPTLGYVKEQAREILSISHSTWKKLGINGRESAWKLPLARQQLQILSIEKHLEIDDLIRSTAICWNGCPECLVNQESSVGGLFGGLLLDKAVLDEWFRLSRQKSPEYLAVDLESLALGRVKLPFGRLSRVVLDLPNRRVRSVSLPYTIGIEVPRNPIEMPHLVVRASDIENLYRFPERTESAAHGVESLGFKRLLWHDLILTAFLDLLGLLPKERRIVRAVFYDCRDIGFEDVGVSASMLDALAAHSKNTKQALTVPDRLSSMLVWLKLRGFEVSICVDETRLGEHGVDEFINRLRKGGCSVASKRLSGIMHKKAIVTPLAVISGSANLTQGGTGANEEIIGYAQWGSDEYSEIETAVRDTFHGSIPVE